MQNLSLSLVLQKGDAPFGRHIFNAVETGSTVGLLNSNSRSVYDDWGVVANCLCEELVFVFFQSQTILVSSVAIPWLHLPHFLEGMYSFTYLAQGHICLTLPVDTFNIERVELYCFICIDKSQLILF